MRTTVTEHATRRDISWDQAQAELHVLCRVGYLRPVKDETGATVYEETWPLKALRMRRAAMWN